jgi:hypothetical protein
MKHLERSELLNALEELEFFPELKKELSVYLYQYVHQSDLEMIQLLLKAGANPNPKENLDCYLHHLLHEYIVTKSTKGEYILQIARSLLAAGANPNRVWSNNWRAYDYAADDNYVSEYAALLLEYGADPFIREKI